MNNYIEKLMNVDLNKKAKDDIRYYVRINVNMSHFYHFLKYSLETGVITEKEIEKFKEYSFYIAIFKGNLEFIHKLFKSKYDASTMIAMAIQGFDNGNYGLNNLTFIIKFLKKTDNITSQDYSIFIKRLEDIKEENPSYHDERLDVMIKQLRSDRQEILEKDWKRVDLEDKPVDPVIDDQSEIERAKTLELNDIPRSEKVSDQGESDRFKMLDLDEVMKRIKLLKEDKDLNQEIKEIIKKSKIFGNIWKGMESSIEDTKFHKGETTAQHTENVLNSMNKLIEFTSVEEKELYKLLAILHDVGKLSTREEKDGKISFHGHAKSGIEIANKILDEIVYKDKELLLFLIEHHMDVFNAIDTGNYEFLAKNDKLYKNIKYLINMAKADIEKNNPEQIEEISQLFKKVEEKRKEIEKKKEEQENKRKLDKEISLEDFIKNLNKKNISKDVKIKAIKGKFKNISDDEVNKFNLNEVMKRIKLLKEDFYLDRELVDAVESGSLNKVKECIKYGADIHVWNDYPLRFAVAEGHFDIVKYLLSDKREDKADIHTVEPYALREALENGHFDIIEYLLDNGVDGTFIEDDEVYKQWEKKKDAENKRKEAEGRWTQADLTEIPIKSVSDQSESERAQTLDLNDIPRTKTSTDQSESDRFKMLDLDEIWRRIKNVK